MTATENSVDLISHNIFTEVIQKYEKTQNSDLPLFVIIGGVPGGGKTTVTEKLKELLLLYFEENKPETSAVQLSSISADCAEDIEYLNNIVVNAANVTHTSCEEKNHLINYQNDVQDYASYKILKYDTNKQPYYSIQSIGGEKTRIEVHLPCENIYQSAVATIPMDGFHVPRAVLSQYENSEEALIKRGHFETFDSKNYLNFIKLLLSKNELLLKYPGFSHEDKDPMPNFYTLQLTNKKMLKICILEGLYNLFNKDNYGKSIVSELKNQNHNYLSYFIDSTDSVLEERVSKRHLQSGIVATLEEGVNRFRQNDLKNAKLVRDNMVDDEKMKVIFT